MTDIRLLQTLLAERLPLRARWHLGEMLWDWDFMRARSPLKPLSGKELIGGVFPVEWDQIYIFGQQDFGQGGGASPFVGIHLETGRVHGLDVEREKLPVYLLNSTVPQFIETFLLFDRALGAGAGSSAWLAGKARALDLEAFDRSEWKDATDEIEAWSKS